MTRRRRLVTIVVHRDGDIDSRSYRLPLTVFRALKVTGIVVGVVIVVAAVLYTPIARTAARVPGLNREVASLSRENEQVTRLAQTLAELESRYEQMRNALGATVIPAGEGMEFDDPYTAHPIHAGPPVDADPLPLGASLPVYWPLDSIYDPAVLTRGLIAPGGPDEQHPGIDLAVRTGTPIRASGGGRVLEAGYDAEYGLFVLLEHADGYQTMYGHASRLLVATGDSVNAREVIALVGNTGRSTAPHLHFEKRLGNQLIDPLGQLNAES